MSVTKTGGVDVSDHAVLRWLERADGTDVEALRRAIGNTCRAAVLAGATKFCCHGVTYVIRDGTVVSVIPGEKPDIAARGAVEAHGLLNDTERTRQEAHKRRRRERRREQGR